MAKPGEGMPPEVVEILGKTPTTTAVLTEVVKRLKLEEMSRSEIAANFDDVLKSMMDKGIDVLEKVQVATVDALVNRYVEVRKKDPARAYTIIHKGFTALGNQRKKRAGVHMERCVQYLLDRCKIPNEKGKAINALADVVVPSTALMETYPEQCVVLEFKRTTRERWKQVRDEIARTGLKVWLLTLDDYFSESLVETMGKANITLYVPEPVYQVFKAKGHNRLRSMRTLVKDLAVFVQKSAA